MALANNPIWDKFAATRHELNEALIERQDEIDLVLCALACQEHVLLIGPPGTAKTMLAEGLLQWMNTNKKWYRLFNKYTTDAEVFGQLSLIGMKADEYRRITRNALPEAIIAVGDEVFNASSSILNSILRILNERKFVNDGVEIVCPLRLFIGGSNKFGNEDNSRDLVAFEDRFLFRKKVRPIAGFAGREALLWSPKTVALSTTITVEELDAAFAQIVATPWTVPAQDALRTILIKLNKEGIQPSDRRMRKAVKAAQAFAWLNGSADVQPEHLDILCHVLWEDPVEQPEKAQKIIVKIANPVSGIITDLRAEAETVAASADPCDLEACIRAVSAIKEIAAKLSTLKEVNGKLQLTKEYVKSLVARITLASMEAGSIKE